MCSRSTSGPSRSRSRTSARWSGPSRSRVHTGRSWLRNRSSSVLSAAYARAIRGACAATTSASWTRWCAAATSCHGAVRRRATRPRAAAAAWTATGSRPPRGDAPREPAAPTFEGEMRRLALEREAQGEQLDEVVAREVGDARAAVGLDAPEPLALEPAQRGPQRVPGDGVGLDELALHEPAPRWQVAVEDPRAERVGELVDGGRGAQRRGGGRAGARAPPTRRRPGR